MIVCDHDAQPDYRDQKLGVRFVSEMEFWFKLDGFIYWCGAAKGERNTILR